MYPNKEKQLLIQCHFDCTLVWNQMLHVMIERYQNSSKVSFIDAYALSPLPQP
ncbi:helix-turn-helix domain-containing protein [Sporolactobacillus shoreicorticis]|uniref:Helix-turn-helix domain-containing protein n=1 Tax=Sporolactobacillus shoreicorticis TaxID=1923877 RepID=A0ABW5SAM4_9BACL